MAKLLETRLPQANGQVEPNTFNRLIRILEINLGKFDPNSTPQFSDSEISSLNFNLFLSIVLIIFVSHYIIF